jgi:hypothetical protein
MGFHEHLPLAMESTRRAASLRKRVCHGGFAIAPLEAAGLAGCASHTVYDSAFSTKTALAGNSHSFDAPTDQTFRTVKITRVQQGFPTMPMD